MLEDYLSKGGTVPQGPIANSRSGARDGIRTRDPDLGKVVLYQLSYSRMWVGSDAFRLPRPRR